MTRHSAARMGCLQWTRPELRRRRSPSVVRTPRAKARMGKRQERDPAQLSLGQMDAQQDQVPGLSGGEYLSPVQIGIGIQDPARQCQQEAHRQGF